jgi:predicted DNA-binding transcriptional regulator AlpA
VYPIALSFLFKQTRFHMTKIVSIKTPAAQSIPAAKAIIHSSVFDRLPDSAMIREAQLVQSPKRPETPAPLPFSAPTLWRKVKQGTFPRPIKLSERVTAWNVGSVRAWLAAQEALAYAPALIAKGSKINTLAAV